LETAATVFNERAFFNEPGIAYHSFAGILQRFKEWQQEADTYCKAKSSRAMKGCRFIQIKYYFR